MVDEGTRPVAWTWVKANLPTMLAVGGILTSAVAFGYGQALRLVQMEIRIEANASNLASLTVDVLTTEVIGLTNDIRELEKRQDGLTVAERSYLTALYEQRRSLERRITEVSR